MVNHFGEETSPSSQPVPPLPNDVIDNLILNNLPLPALRNCSLVCKVWSRMAKKYIEAFCQPCAFGPKEWYEYFGCRLKDIPRLPSNIEAILKSPSLFDPTKTTKEDQILVLIPRSIRRERFRLFSQLFVKDELLTLRIFEEIAKQPKQGPPCRYGSYPIDYDANPPIEPFNTVPETSHWVLMARNIIQETLGENYHSQIEMVASRGQGLYTLPTLLQAMVCIIAQAVFRGEDYYRDKAPTYLECSTYPNFGGGMLAVVIDPHWNSYYKSMSLSISGRSSQADMDWIGAAPIRVLV